MSVLVSTLTNLAVKIHGKKGAKSIDLKEFLFNWDEGNTKKGTQSIEDMKRVFMEIEATNRMKGNKVKSTRIPKSKQK